MPLYCVGGTLGKIAGVGEAKGGVRKVGVEIWIAWTISYHLRLMTSFSSDNFTGTMNVALRMGLGKGLDIPNLPRKKNLPQLYHRGESEIKPLFSLVHLTDMKVVLQVFVVCRKMTCSPESRDRRFRVR